MSTIDFRSLLDESRQDLWRYARLLQPVSPAHRVAGGQMAPTPIVKIGNFLVKREDLSPTGSHKFRSLAYQLSCIRATGYRQAVISSSGNAAISASHYAEIAGIRIFAFLSGETPPEKLSALSTAQTTVILSARPLRLAKYATAHYKLPDLRPSADQNSVIGFQTLGFELFEQLPNKETANIFSFVTSGASLLGIASACQRLAKLGASTSIPRLYGVYSTGKLAGQLSANAVDKYIDTEKTCKQSGGGLIEVTDDEIMSTREQLSTRQIETSDESVAAFSAAEKARPAGQTVVIFTGRSWSTPKKPAQANQFEHAETFADVDKIMSKYLS